MAIPKGYQTVKDRKAQFYKDYEDGRIIVQLIENEGEHTVFKSSVYKNANDQEKGLALATGYAEEFKGQGGFANKLCWFENCEESATSRALDNAGYNNGKCSAEEMNKANKEYTGEGQPTNGKTPTDVKHDKQNTVSNNMKKSLESADPAQINVKIWTKNIETSICSADQKKQLNTILNNKIDKVAK